MKTLLRFILTSALILGFVSCNKNDSRKPNVLFIAVDDLRPQLNSYGDSSIISPNIDRLAEEGIQFNRAYCQTPICMVSRSSLLTGFRPDHNYLYDLRSVNKAGLQDYTINKHFEKNGYNIWATGKIYHYKEDSREQFGENWKNIEKLWYGRGYITEEAKRIVDEYPKEFSEYSKKEPEGRGPAFEKADVADSAYYDGYRTNLAMRKLREFAESENPFFMAVGYKKPHLPFNAPLKYWDLYPEDKIELADNPFLPQYYTEYTKYNFKELRNYYGIPKDDKVLPDQLSKALIRGYNACVTYIDAQIGRLLNELENLGLRENTIIVLWGDHGWKLGEHGMWCKHTPFELDCRVPLIFSYPGQIHKDLKTDKFAELVDIYPTLCDLSGLELPEHLQGNSLVPLFENPEIDWKNAAFTEWPLSPRKDPEKVISGFTIRTEDHRYVEWTRKNTGEVLARELYDHLADPDENINIAALPESEKLIDSLSLILDGGKGWK